MEMHGFHQMAILIQTKLIAAILPKCAWDFNGHHTLKDD